MKKTIWQKNHTTDQLIESFTIGNDREIDLHLAPYDVQASIAHAKMLERVGLLTPEECKDLISGLHEIGNLLQENKFTIEAPAEDIHSQIELYLTERFGDTGKKIHTARSRNDQVLTAIKLFLKNELQQIRELCIQLADTFKKMGDKHKNIALPGYTHFQVAMPSSFENWFKAYAEGLADDIHMIDAAISVCDKNPLGSAAGYGTNFIIDRDFTTKELGFSSKNESPVYAQMTRGKSERSAAVALSFVAATISKFSYDVCLYMCQNFNFISLPAELTTGSSIMPHKKNPDVFELIRGKCNLIQSVPEQLTLLCNNLPSGYHREMQLTKSLVINAILDTKECLNVLLYVLPLIQVNEKCAEGELYQYLYSVNKVNELVMQGVPFRDAYRQVAEEIEMGG